MPRPARYDAPGARHHIIIHRIKQTAISTTARDQTNFRKKLSRLRAGMGLSAAIGAGGRYVGVVEGPSKQEFRR